MLDIVKNIDKDCARYFFFKEWTVLLKKKKKIRYSNTDFPELWELVNLNHAAHITF